MASCALILPSLGLAAAQVTVDHGDPERVDGGALADEHAGTSVALSVYQDVAQTTRERLAVGSPSDGLVTEWVRVFDRVAGDWVLDASIAQVGGATQAGFGTAVDLDGDRLVVGAPMDTAFSGPQGFIGAGAIYVFERGAGGWNQVARVTASSPTIAGALGTSIALHGDTILAGAPAVAGLPSAAHLFVRQANGTWLETQQLLGTMGGDEFGYSVDLGPDRAAVGAPGADQVSTYTRSGGLLVAQATLSAPASSTRFGHALDLVSSIEGPLLGIGAPESDVSVFVDAGLAYLYLEEAGTWNPKGTLFPQPGFGAGDKFGFDLSIRPDVVLNASTVDLVYVGSPNSDTSAANAGRVEVFAAVPQVGAILAYGSPILPTAAGLTSSRHGAALDANDCMVAVGAPGDDSVASNAGSTTTWRATMPVEIYCTGKVNSLGATPAIGWAGGVASPSSSAAALISCANAIPSTAGWVAFGTNGPAVAPFNGGTLCVQPPLGRGPVGLSDATGFHSTDFNGIFPHGQLSPGITVHAQFFLRDPGDPTGYGLSNALTFTICP